MVSLTLILVMAVGCTTVESNTDIKVIASEKEQNYIIQVSSESVLANTVRMYDEVETVTEVGRKELKDENIAAVSLTKSEAEKLKKNNNIVMIEMDKNVKAAKSNKLKKIKYKDIDLEWNKKIIKSRDNNRINAKKRVKIAVIDSGVDWGNDIDLEETITLVPGEEDINPLFMDGSKKDYRLRDLTKNINEVTNDNIGRPYSAFNLSNTTANKGIIEYYWEG